MPTQVDIQPGSTADQSVDVERTLDEVGIEFEYPVASNRDNPYIGEGLNSRELRDAYGLSEDWLPGEFPGMGGYMGRDHTGSEITSGRLPIHSDAPERWYRLSIQVAEELGYPFARCGYGDTNFGCHLHLSSLDDDVRDMLVEMCREPWSKVFFCGSITRTSADPWRHGGVHTGAITESASTNLTPLTRYSAGAPNHYEFRLPEPVAADHFELIMDFLREAEYRGPEAARSFAYELVHDRDDRLTPVRQYRALQEQYDDWPDQQAVMGGSVTNTEFSEYMVDLMGD